MSSALHTCRQEGVSADFAGVRSRITNQQSDQAQSSPWRRLVRKDLLLTALLTVVLLLSAGKILSYVRLQPAVESEIVVYEGQPLGIKDVVRRVKQELYEADLERIQANEAPLFELEYFDLELNFMIESRSKASVGAEPLLVVVGKETEVASQKIQKIRIHWTASSRVEGQGSIASTMPSLTAQDLANPPSPTEEE